MSAVPQIMEDDANVTTHRSDDRNQSAPRVAPAPSDRTIGSEAADHLTVVFDLDGTLVDTAPDLVGAAHHVMVQLGLPPTPADQLRPWISYGAQRMIEEAMRPHGLDPADHGGAELLEAFLAHYIANIAAESRPFPHVISALTELRAAGIKLGVCTNKRTDLAHALLDALEMTAMFDAIAGRGTFPVHKPDPAHLTGTIEMAGGSLTRAIMVGDSDVDVATARAANVPVIAVTFGYSQLLIAETKPDMLIESYAAFVEDVARLAHTLA